MRTLTRLAIALGLVACGTSAVTSLPDESLDAATVDATDSATDSNSSDASGDTPSDASDSGDDALPLSDGGTPITDSGPCSDAAYCADQVAAHATTIVANHVSKPWPPKGTCWGDTTYAFAALATNQDLTAANTLLANLSSNYATATAVNVEDDCYWAHQLFVRILLHASSAPNVSAAARTELTNIMLSYVMSRSRVSDTAAQWTISGSENHDANRKSVYLMFTQLLEASGKGATLLADGKSVSAHRAAWESYWLTYLRQHAREGISVEMGSPTYAKYLLQGIYNLRDFASSAQLRTRSALFLDLFWADYAQDFIATSGIRGGATTRSYKDEEMALGTGEGLRAMTWMYGWHANAGVAVNTNPSILTMATSDYVVPRVVTAMATQASTHRYVSRRFGFGTQSSDPQGIAYNVQFQAGNSSLLRTSYWTPSYVLGTLSLNTNLEYIDLVNQNRTMGVIFSSAINDRIVVFGQGADQISDGGVNGRRGYAEIYGASAKDALVTARDPNVNKSAGMMVFLSNGAASTNLVTDTAQRSFTFVGDSYVSISVATGTWTLQPYVFDGVTLGSVLKLSDPWAPIAVQLGTKSDYATFDAFKTAVKTKTTATYDAASGKFTYTSLDGNVFVIRKYLGSTVPALPTVDGALALNPALTYDSPYLSGSHGSDLVTLSFPGYASTVLDFSK